MKSKACKYGEDIVKLAYKYVSSNKKYLFLFEDEKDYASELMFAASKSIEKYDETRSSISTFIYLVFESRIKQKIDYFNRHKRKANVISLDEVVTEDGETLNNIIPDEKDLMEDIHERIFNQEIINMIKPYLSDVFLKYHYYGMTLAEIAKDKNISRQAVQSKIAKEKIRIDKAIKENNLELIRPKNCNRTMEKAKNYMEENNVSLRTYFRHKKIMEEKNENNKNGKSHEALRWL